MKFKKQKRHRRSVRFYTACFGFREPFKVLCDGTFIHHLVANRISPPDTALSKILGASVKIFTTRCVLAELKSLGESYSASLKEGHNFIPARCDHEKRKSAVACIEEVIGEKNPEHFFVATQDVELRRKFQEFQVRSSYIEIQRITHLWEEIVAYLRRKGSFLGLEKGFAKNRRA